MADSLLWPGFHFRPVLLVAPQSALLYILEVLASALVLLASALVLLEASALVLLEASALVLLASALVSLPQARDCGP
jgi:hypothetical protein